MGTHPIFESDFDCLTDSEANIGQDGQRAQDTKDLFKVDQQACHFQSDPVQAGKASLYAQGKRRYDRKQSGYVVRPNPSSTRRPRPLKRLCSVLSAPNPRRRSFWSSSDASTSSLVVTRRERIK